MVETPTYSNLVSEISDALAAHYREWVATHDADEIYAYVIYPTALVSRVAVSVLTEQGLRHVASQYKTKYGCTGTVAQLVTDLRWSVADTPYCGDYQEVFDSVNDCLERMMAYVDSLEIDDPAFDKHIDTLYSILVAALKQFRHTVLNDSAQPLLYVDFGDMTDEERLAFVEQCNPSEMVDWFRSSYEMVSDS